MTLKDYLAQAGNSATKLAKEVGVSVSTITRAANGETLPSRGVRDRIRSATDGQVTTADIIAACDAAESVQSPASAEAA